jgi:hypothetical protein
MSKNKQVEEQPAAPVATIVAPSSTKREKVRKSLVEFPVARTWQISHELCLRAREAGEPIPARKVLVDTCINAGIATDTAKTQVQQYLKASLGGTVTPQRGPKNLTFSE